MAACISSMNAVSLTAIMSTFQPLPSSERLP
jgi:hypothetical protein